MNLRNRLTTRPAALLAAGAVLALAVGGFAVAAIPSADGTIRGCYAKTSSLLGPQKGTLRVLDEGQSCKSYEVALTWNQRGQQGDTGPAGAQGPEGPAGPAGEAAPRPHLLLEPVEVVEHDSEGAPSFPPGWRVIGTDLKPYGSVRLNFINSAGQADWFHLGNVGADGSYDGTVGSQVNACAVKDVWAMSNDNSQHNLRVFTVPEPAHPACP